MSVTSRSFFRDQARRTVLQVLLLAMVRRFTTKAKELNGHLLYALGDSEHAAAGGWLERQGIFGLPDRRIFDQVESRSEAAWEDDAGLMTYGEAVATCSNSRLSEANPLAAPEEWRRSAARASLHARQRGQGAMPIHGTASWPRPRRATTRSAAYRMRSPLAAAPFADILWMETKTADLADARQFVEAIHAEFPTR